MEISKQLQKFIEDLKIYEEKKDVNPYEKYQFGECVSLVSYLYIIDKERGEKIEINSELDEFSEDYPQHHYIYKASSGKYYDINGEAENIWEIVAKCDLFSDYQINGDLIRFKSEGLSILVDEKRENFVKRIINHKSQKKKSKLKKM